MGMPFESKRYKGRRECKTEGTENELLEETPCRREVQRPITNPRISARESKAPNRYGEYIMYRRCSTKKYYRLHALDVWLDQGPYPCTILYNIVCLFLKCFVNLKVTRHLIS